MTFTASPQPTQPQQTSFQGCPAQVLQAAITEQRSGRLTVTDPQDPSVGWRVYFGKGQLHFAESTAGQQERFEYLINHRFPNLKLSLKRQFDSDYQRVCHHWRHDRLPLDFIRELLLTLTQEALCHLLAIPQAELQFESKVGLDPLLVSVPLRQLLLPVRPNIKQWAQIRADISSPFQRPQIRDRDQYLQMVWQAMDQCQQLQNLSRVLVDDPCLYQVADRLQLDVMNLANVLRPLVTAGVVEFTPYQVLERPNLPVIACVDDSKTIQQFVRLALEPLGYDVLQLMDPTEALMHLIEYQPQLILMDIEMPKMDGYELCQMVRQVEILRDTPVVMLTGREGFVDRIRARMVGSSAYLTKPFDFQELKALVQKLSQGAHPQPVASL